MGAEHSGPTAAVDEFFARLMDLVTPWVNVVLGLYAQGDPSRREVDEAMGPLASAVLAGRELDIIGAGFVAAAGALRDAEWHMAWWQGADAERLLIEGEDVASEAYARREWFVVPLETGRAHATGPYVDFLCTDEYTVTTTAPVMAGARAIGVVGADVLASSLERTLGPALRRVAPRAHLVNGHGRVIVSADPRVAAGTLLLADGAGSNDAGREVATQGGPARLFPCAALDLAVVIA